jgi:hypothetical protein
VAHRVLFDSDSFDILVDGGATASIFNCLANFIQPPTTTNIRIKGFNGTYSAARIGTVRWPILDDEGVKYVLQIPDTYFVASCPMRLLSPQQYSQQIHNHRGNYSTNFGDQVVFVFHKKKFQVTIPLRSLLGLQTVESQNANPVSMEKLPSVLGELRDSQVPSRRSPYQANAFQWINLSHQWLGLLDRTKDSSFTSATSCYNLCAPFQPVVLYVYLQESTKGVQTLAAKRSFEAYSSSHGVKVQQYHADNGRFAEHLFLNHCEKSGQKVSLCGVSAHFPNGIAERRIKDLTERSRTSLLHAIHRWPSAVTINLWPHALRYINEVYNATPTLKTGKSPLEAFSQTAIRPKVLDFHPPFCPVYVLHNGLQSVCSGLEPPHWICICTVPPEA